MKTNSPYAWLLAARPKTLTGAAVPVMIGIAMAYHVGTAAHFRLIPAILCMLFAFVMQIDANFVNDYFDCKRGNDDETRLGPKRACSEGWITMPAMLKGIIATTIIACGIGLPLVYYGGFEMILIGLLCVVFCFLYTTLFSYLGLGDVLVLIFFGLVPVCLTEYLCISPEINLPLHGVGIKGLIMSVACGIVIDTLLLVNNYRDIDNDRTANKNTLIVRIGKEKGLRLYLCSGIAGAVLFLVAMVLMSGLQKASLGVIFIMPYIVLHVATYKQMVAIDHGRELNKTLGNTARNMFVYGLTTSAAIIVCSMI